MTSPTPQLRRKMNVAVAALASYAACNTPAPVAAPPASTTTTTTTATVAQAADPTELDWDAVARIPKARIPKPRADRGSTRPRSRIVGGELPPAWVLARESGGDIRIWNGRCYAPIGWEGRSPCGTSSASGKWQITRGTWGGYEGYLNAADAPESVQDDKARQLWAGGNGCGHWGAC